jgi:hypothetical protein
LYGRTGKPDEGAAKRAILDARASAADVQPSPPPARVRTILRAPGIDQSGSRQQSQGKHMNQEKTYQGACFCGAVEISVSGEPAGMGYCHCESCRSWSAGPVNAFTLWKPDAVKVTRGAASIGSFNKTPHSHRKWCRNCGGHLYTEHPGMGLTDVYAATIPSFPFQPGVHVNYQETHLRMKDGLPKMKDMPAEMGGSGVALAE